MMAEDEVTQFTLRRIIIEVLKKDKSTQKPDVADNFICKDSENS